MKTMKVTKCHIDMEPLNLMARGINEQNRNLACETIKLINSIEFGDGLTYEISNAEAFKEALRRGAFRKATKREIENDYYITVKIG